ncbi:MAG: hypothetical protein ACYSUI_15555, partial [Planctomycetota bacterium]
MRKVAILLACSSTVLVTLTISAPKSGAYPTYSQDRDATNCRACHGDFRAGSYISLSDGQNWGNLHDLHRFDMLDNDCITCHVSPGSFPVETDSSGGGAGFDPIGCMGCHGRDEDMGNDSISMGRGAGLRQHHFNTGVTLCTGCHTDADPLNYTPVGEDVPPPYYFTPDPNHPNKPTDSCNPNGEEDYAGNAEGLDNDGDNAYDEAADGDCSPAQECADAADCDDGVSCTNDDCVGGECVSTPNGANCPDDGLFCNGSEVCDAVNDCVSTGDPCQLSESCNESTDTCDACQVNGDCDDGVGCTDDTCVAGSCVYTPNDGNCADDGLFCNGNEVCDAVNDCVSTGDPCQPGEFCNETTDTC